MRNKDNFDGKLNRDSIQAFVLALSDSLFRTATRTNGSRLRCIAHKLSQRSHFPTGVAHVEQPLPERAA